MIWGFAMAAVAVRIAIGDLIGHHEGGRKIRFIIHTCQQHIADVAFMATGMDQEQQTTQEIEKHPRANTFDFLMARLIMPSASDFDIPLQ
jgi:hypothetical protein